MMFLLLIRRESAQRIGAKLTLFRIARKRSRTEFPLYEHLVEARVPVPPDDRCRIGFEHDQRTLRRIELHDLEACVSCQRCNILQNGDSRSEASHRKARRFAGVQKNG